ncbi:MAG: 50S ribosomal protein L9 [Bacteroidia bacterium]|jgi:large subunit ribosomal protein L9|uniref:50S ribosomal protein L9 n=1 Tax=bioreactor metagenome TaxID=1076179 RepID=A0A645A015_9ZZZZ|nr:50S ribosomal protein L9 [Rikenellaceae bacterium]NCB18510.1 50S ribosomal protein L9 [Bacteroidia bacterium]
MEIILKQDVPNLGHKDDIVIVRNGYATNYLIPQGFAILATPSAKKMHAENMRQRAHKETKIREEAQALAAKLEGIQVTLATKVSSTGKIFGSVNNIQIAEALAAKGFEIDRRNITISGEEAVKEVGIYDAVVKCHKEIKANIKIEVVAED